MGFKAPSEMDGIQGFPVSASRWAVKKRQNYANPL
jgi:hypothetical protein